LRFTPVIYSADTLPQMLQSSKWLSMPPNRLLNFLWTKSSSITELSVASSWISTPTLTWMLLLLTRDCLIPYSSTQINWLVEISNWE
jgi:hypothetical protein